ncbi:MAG: amino acid ABC transporter permease [Synergistaceae bacterium]|nr:amino acid ABC transporter permease [Synergistaceae bacterium]
MLFDINNFTSLFPIVLSALGLTSEIAVWSLIGTLILSVIIAITRYYRVPVMTQFFDVFITIFRATPLVVELFMIFFALPCIFPALRAMTPFQATVLSLIFNTSAFMAESFRAALESVDKGQIEACYSLGMTKRQAMTRVILPQAFVVAVPSIGNHFIGIIKGTALGFTVGLADVMGTAKMEAALSLRFFEAYLCVTIVYVAIVLAVEFLLRLIERKMQNLY